LAHSVRANTTTATTTMTITDDDDDNNDDDDDDADNVKNSTLTAGVVAWLQLRP